MGKKPSSQEADSREKLEDDANTLAIDYWDRKRTWGDADDLKREVIALLDRQAATTERECREYENELRRQHHRRVNEVKKVVDELIAERDEWKAEARQAERAMNRAAGNWAQADAEKRELDEANEYHKCQYELACEDADRLREVVKTQANSFTKLEAENAELRRQAKIAGVERGRLLAKIRELSSRVVEGERMAMNHKERALDLVQANASLNTLAWDVANVTHYTYDEAQEMFDQALADLIAAMLEELDEQVREMNDYDSVVHESDIPMGLR